MTFLIFITKDEREQKGDLLESHLWYYQKTLVILLFFQKRNLKIGNNPNLITRTLYYIIKSLHKSLRRKFVDNIKRTYFKTNPTLSTEFDSSSVFFNTSFTLLSPISLTPSTFLISDSIVLIGLNSTTSSLNSDSEDLLIPLDQSNSDRAVVSIDSEIPRQVFLRVQNVRGSFVTLPLTPSSRSSYPSGTIPSGGNISQSSHDSSY